MQRKKRHLRLKSFIFKIGNYIKIIELDDDEQLKCSLKEKEEVIKNIKIKIENYKSQDKKESEESESSNNDDFSESNVEKTENTDFGSKVSIENDGSSITIDLVNDNSDELKSKCCQNLSIHDSDKSNKPCFKERNKFKLKKSIDNQNMSNNVDNSEAKSIYSFSENLLYFSDGDDNCLYQNDEDFTFF